MADIPKLNRPWLVAIWPGMGHVASTAGYYLMSKLEMHMLAEISAKELFDIEHVEVKHGLIHTGHRPRSRFLLGKGASPEHDLVVFLGEAQPPQGKYAFCRRLIEFAQQLGVERVFTFAAMATQMHPQQEPRVFAAATDTATLEELRQLELETLSDGQIGGLNGLLLGVAAEEGLHGACLLGEIPHVLAQIPFPKASYEVLRKFTTLAGISIDFDELSEQVRAADEQIGQLMSQVEAAMQQRAEPEEEEETYDLGLTEEPKLSPEDEQRIERMFEEAAQDRSRAYELKRELDRLDVFQDYEDRFLDMFTKPE
jgi:proteasome assembly chaperone (PAC2) family protein